jgi:hypothetical protein
LFAAGAATLLALVFFAYLSAPALADDPKCGLLQDCTFDHFYGDEGSCSGIWKCDNPAGLALAPSEGWPSGPSLKVTGPAAFERKIWQRVAVTPGKGYRFFAPFAVVNVNGQGWHEGDQVNRRLGIDPFGGTDPNSSNIHWSPDFFLKGRFQDDQLQINEYARSPFLTVFIWVINPYNDRHVDVFIDTPGLVENPDMPPIQVTQPTVTPPPPPPTQVPPAVRPTAAATNPPPPTDEPTMAPSDTPTLRPTDVPTRRAAMVAATQGAQLQVTARPTRGRSTSLEVSNETDAAGGLQLGFVGMVGLVGISGALLLGAAGVFLLLRRK